jgi:hypothetical protein
MQKMALAGAVAIAAILQGCAVAQPGSPAAGGGPKEFLTKTCDGNDDCWITVSVPDLTNHASAKVDYDRVEIKKKKKSQIYWKMPADCYFYPTAGDGVFLKSIDQVDDGFELQQPVKQPENNPKLEPFKASWYHWFSKNPVRKEYSYKVIFHCGTDQTPFIIDPVIFNEGN